MINLTKQDLKWSPKKLTKPSQFFFYSKSSSVYCNKDDVQGTLFNIYLVMILNIGWKLEPQIAFI